jgi:Uma2 family endonuclease
MITTLPLVISDIDYPDSDGLPMAESDLARNYLVYGVEALNFYFRDQPHIYVSGNLFIYYEKGNPKAVIAPDVFVIFGVTKKARGSYKVWEEDNQVPAFVLEITSKSTVSEDQGTKWGLYAYLGVREYFQYDPTSDHSIYVPESDVTIPLSMQGVISAANHNTRMEPAR